MIRDEVPLWILPGAKTMLSVGMETAIEKKNKRSVAHEVDRFRITLGVGRGLEQFIVPCHSRCRPDLECVDEDCARERTKRSLVSFS